MSKAYTKEELASCLVNHFKNLAFYWSKQEGSKKDICEGVVHSILCTLDGVSGGFPCAIDLVMSPHPEDKQFHIDEGDNYVEEGMCINDNIYLHDLLYKDE